VPVRLEPPQRSFRPSTFRADSPALVRRGGRPSGFPFPASLSPCIPASATLISTHTQTKSSVSHTKQTSTAHSNQYTPEWLCDSLVTNHESLITNHLFLPGTPSRVESPVTRSKQTIETRSTRNSKRFPRGVSAHDRLVGRPSRESQPLSVKPCRGWKRSVTPCKAISPVTCSKQTIGTHTNRQKKREHAARRNRP